jgi:hypothetical protein
MKTHTETRELARVRVSSVAPPSSLFPPPSSFLLRRLHRDQRGTISILSVFTVMFLVMLLGMVMNVGRHVDGKIRMQNAADDAAYSGGVVLARAMNDLAFTNHLLCDVFAVTAFLRESRDHNAESYVSSILAAWSKVATVFAESGIPKFTALGTGIQGQVPLEQEMVRAYGQWAAAASEQLLPMFEEILSTEAIPKYQRAVVETFPDLARQAANEAAARNSEPSHGRGRMVSVLWRTNVEVVGEDAATSRTLPVVDPENDNEPGYASASRKQRDRLAHHYLDDWNNEAMCAFDREGKMSQFGSLWRSFTCGQLEKLLNEEYPDRNLLHMIREPPAEGSSQAAYLRQYYSFISVVYWQKLKAIMPRLFTNPIDADAQAYAEIHLFIPRARLEWQWLPEDGGPTVTPIGSVPGDWQDLGLDNEDPQKPTGEGRWVVGRQNVPMHWDLLNQSWASQLAPAVDPELAQILQTTPTSPEFAAEGLRVPSLGGLSGDDIGKISTH